ncbi:interleukin-20 receptor subunit alpha [Sebastes fasciatus]|uniref:interleukin-20 receptor subunit alpha n=1 Tax=Sebastes fasciatus TaxID=394691 RepID=UPI003D9ED47A
MWTVLILLLNVGGLRCIVSSSPPSPTNVIFSSVDLRNVLQWFPGSGTPDNTHFTVQYAIYGDSVAGSKGKRVNWRTVRHCTEMARSWCDLSDETWDLEQGYHARVRAVSQREFSKWALTRRRFDPKTDTSFGPPLVSVEIEDNKAIINLKGPMKYQPNNHTPAEVSMATIYRQMTYNLSIYNTHREQTHHVPVASSLYKYRLMDYDTKYCFSAKSRLLSMPAQCQSSSWQCITTPQDPLFGQLQNVVVGIVVSTVCMCMMVVVGYFLYRYLTGKGRKSPYILDPPAFHQPVLTFPPENPNLLVITIIKEIQPGSGKYDPAFPKRPQHVPLGYACQRPETPPEPEEHWDDLSVDYGFVGAAPKITFGGEDWSDTKGEHQKCAARDSYERKEWRVKDARTAGHTQTEMSTLIQARAWSPPALLTQIQAPLLSFQGALGEVDGEGEEEEDREFPGIFISTTPKTGLFRIPLNPGEEMDGKVTVRTDEEIDGGVEERSENEEVPLLSTYATQNTTYKPTSHSDQSDFLPDDYGVLRVATAHAIEEDEGEEKEEGAICINWDPQTRKLVLPGMALEFNREGGLDGEKGMMGGEKEEEVNSLEGELRLENVFVRQGSEEEREMERGGGAGWETDDFLTRWNLVISMDE